MTEMVKLHTEKSIYSVYLYFYSTHYESEYFPEQHV